MFIGGAKTGGATNYCHETRRIKNDCVVGLTWARQEGFGQGKTNFVENARVQGRKTKGDVGRVPVLPKKTLKLIGLLVPE